MRWWHHAHAPLLGTEGIHAMSLYGAFKVHFKGA